MKLRHRLFLSIFLIGTTCVVAMIGDRAASTRVMLRERSAARAEALAAAVAREIAEPLRRGDGAAVEERLRIFAEISGVDRIRVADMSGRELHAAERGFGSAGRDALHSVGRELMAGANGTAASVEVSIYSEGLNSSIHPILARGIMWGGLSIVFLAIAAWWMGSLAGRKIEELVEAVANPSGDSPLPDIERSSEIGSLSRAFQELRRRLKEEGALRAELEGQRDEMINMLVHDMKHPLTVFRMAMAALDEASPGERGEVRLALSLAGRSTARMEAMIDGVLQAARLEHSMTPVEKLRLPVAKFLEDCAAEDRLIAVASGREWRMEIPPEIRAVWVLAQPAMLRRLMGNLVLNALDHSPAGTPVSVGARLSDKERAIVELYVASDGSELAADPASLLRGKYQSTGGSSHAGLGLAFCLLAAKSHSGRMEGRRLEDGRVVFSVLMPYGGGPERENGRPKEVSHGAV